MSPLRRVAGEQAGPAALGILVPPGRRTFVILRPRALEIDLLLLQSGPLAGSPVFLVTARHEASRLAQALFQALEAWLTDGTGRTETVELKDGNHGIRVEIGNLPLLACPREPGQPYRPLAFARVEEAQNAARTLTTALRPGTPTEHEVYFNTQHFSR